MSLKDDLLKKGYFPDNLPPSFFSDGIGAFLQKRRRRGFLSNSKKPVRSAPYNASKRGITRRTFSVIHPVTAHDLAEFTSANWVSISEFLGKGTFSLSVPQHAPDSQRALEISSHSELEAAKLSRLSQYRFIAKTDISRFYHAIYTHSIPWAFHGRLVAKDDRSPQSKAVFFNRADQILRCGQDGQTIGIPVGPDTSRVFAEIISTAIDLNFQNDSKELSCGVIRHVDDVWIGANSYDEAETALTKYREAIREFELDINEGKTKIYSDDFRFTDAWPTEIAGQLEFAIESSGWKASERLRAALEHAFALAVANNDDGILKYVIRYLDRSDLKISYWSIIEPFLKRVAVHFGHTIDYVARIVVWRHLTHGELDRDTWSNIVANIINRHGRLGNDSEVCWAIYMCMQLGFPVPDNATQNIVANCGALSILALLNSVEAGLLKPEAFTNAYEWLLLEDAAGPYWPLLLEWKARRWPNHENFAVQQDLVQGMADDEIVIYDPKLLPPVFRDVSAADFGEVARAIEQRTDIYEDEEDEGEKAIADQLDQPF